MTLAADARLGPYEVVELLGAGGMGEVYRAKDPRLDREVAVKVLPAEVAQDPQRLAFFEREAKAVAALNHPNILTVHDVGTHEGTPYVITELLEGENLRELVSRRTPTVSQVLGYALQVARGLEAAHAKGLVHRDLKPENLFLTTDGRLKVLDFGLAKLVRSDVDVRTDVSTAARTTPPGQVVGTVLYMSPEQARAQSLDPRSDVFSFGVVLYELLARKHPFRRDSAVGTLTAIVEETPAGLESLGRGIPPAVGGIVRRCLEKAKEDRYPSGHEVAVALEAVLAAPSESAALLEVEERSPYPGLSSFTEKDAGVFFGREREVEALWGRIQNRKLLAVIGPSGVGKTSFVRAGVVAGRPEGWAAVVCTPGNRPFHGLGQALVRELAGDVEALERILSIEDLDTAVELLGRWRRGHAEALLVVDQFEELTTLNPTEMQGRFATLLARVAAEADVHVLLSVRDDFLIRCCEHKPLAPVLEGLTALLALDPDDLRRAIEEPAKKRGYRFDDETLVGEMVSAVEGARGALPLLAFAAARLWEKRGRVKKLLTREAYVEIAGVEGALAQHAEATMDRIGLERQDLVREIFRNLVTAQGTRAVMDREELLSAFPDREAAEAVLRQLVDARLLTSYEVKDTAPGSSPHRIEIVHESLLKAWPRLVRWQTQDEDGAQLRDQLKQAAHLWDEKDRTPDLLWSGTAFQEFELWRERYPGKLTALEEDFSSSMVERAQRRRRVRHVAVASAFATVLAVASVTGFLWRRSEVARERAAAEALRAEASKLLALGQARLEDDPTEALALTIASLELSDSREARVFANRTLWEAPPALEVATPSGSRIPTFSPDGRWLAVAGHNEEVSVWAETGERVALLPGHRSSGNGSNLARWSRTGHLVTGLCCGLDDRVRVWDMPGGRHVRTIEFGRPSLWEVRRNHLVSGAIREGGTAARGILELRSWALPDGSADALGSADPGLPRRRGFTADGKAWLYAQGDSVYMRSLPSSGSPDRLVARSETDVLNISVFDDRVVWGDSSGMFHVWSFSGRNHRQIGSFEKPDTAPAHVSPEQSGRWLIRSGQEAEALIWSLASWPAARPLALRRKASWYLAGRGVHPTGDWLAVSNRGWSRLTFWPLRRGYPIVVDGYTSAHRPLAFSPDSRWLATSWSLDEDRLRLWPVGEKMQEGFRLLELPEQQLWLNMRFGPSGRFLFAVGSEDSAFVVPLDGSPPTRLTSFSDDANLKAAAVSPSGRRVATALSFGGPDAERSLRVLDLETGEERLLALPEGVEQILAAVFADETTLYTSGHRGIYRWDLESGASGLVLAARPGHNFDVHFDSQGRRALGLQDEFDAGSPCRPLEIIELTSGVSRTAPELGECSQAIALDPSGTVAATGDTEGLVRVGKLGQGEPHILAGHSALVTHVAISPDLQWVASAGEDNTLRLWPMPDLDEPPLHTLPRDELLAKLGSLTNLRAVRDTEAPNGWKIELDPFPGWTDVPTW